MTDMTWRDLYSYNEEVLQLKEKKRGKAFVRCYSCNKFLFSGDITVVETRKKGGRKMRRFCAEKKGGNYCHETVPFPPHQFCHGKT